MFLEGCNQFFIRVSVGAVAGLQISEAVQIVFFGKGVCCFLSDYNIITQAECICGSVPDAHVGMETGHNDGLDSKFLQKDVQVGLEEAAVTSLGYYKVLVAELQFRDDFGTRGACYCVVSPDLQFTVYSGDRCRRSRVHPSHELL